MSDFPASSRVYSEGTLHRSVRVPFRDISQKDNPTMRVYDTRGPWGDPEVQCESVKGLPPLRREWIVARGDVGRLSHRPRATDSATDRGTRPATV